MTNLGVWKLFSNVDSPGCRAETTVEDPSRRWKWRENQSVVEDPVEDLVHDTVPVRFVLPTRR